MDIPDLYPFATQDGKHIPLDIIKPKGLILVNLNNIAISTIAIPEDATICTLFTTHLAIGQQGVAMPGLINPEVFYEGMFYLPPVTTIVLSLAPGDLHLRTIDNVAATVYIQFITKWAGLALARQYTKK